MFLSSRVRRILSQIAAFMAPNFHRSVPIGHGGESILFIYRVLFAVPPRYAYSSAEALAGLLIPYYQCLWDFPRVTGPSAMVNACVFTRWTRRISRSPNGSFYSYWRIGRKDTTSIQHHTDAGILTPRMVVISYGPMSLLGPHISLLVLRQRRVGLFQ